MFKNKLICTYGLRWNLNRILLLCKCKEGGGFHSPFFYFWHENCFNKNKRRKMIELILYGFIVWHICCFIMNIVHKDRLTFIRVFRAICVALLFGKVLGEYLYEILG